MSIDMAQTKTKTEGAVKAGNGEYCFAINELEAIDAGPGYSTSRGGVVEGERMLVGYIPVSYTHLTLPTSDLV